MSDLSKSAQNTVLIIPESLFVSNYRKILDQFNSKIEDGANINHENMTEMVTDILVNDIINNENL